MKAFCRKICCAIFCCKCSKTLPLQVRIIILLNLLQYFSLWMTPRGFFQKTTEQGVS